MTRAAAYNFKFNTPSTAAVYLFKENCQFTNLFRRFCVGWVQDKLINFHTFYKFIKMQILVNITPIFVPITASQSTLVLRAGYVERSPAKTIRPRETPTDFDGLRRFSRWAYPNPIAFRRPRYPSISPPNPVLSR